MQNSVSEGCNETFYYMLIDYHRCVDYITVSQRHG